MRAAQARFLRQAGDTSSHTPATQGASHRPESELRALAMTITPTTQRAKPDVGEI
jgi:hypothetical protein